VQPKQKRPKKPEGVSREVFVLHNEAQKMDVDVSLPMAPTLASNSPSGFKEKRKINRKATAWLWKPFRNSARKDGAVFHHWAKAADKQDDYIFSRFNKKITFFEYTTEQYDIHFNSDPEWTRNETDELWDLCKRFDLRFVAIHDRFSNSSKTVEDLKARYYTVSAKLLDLNALPDEDTSKHPLKKFGYKREHEIERKKQYERMYSRSKDEVEEENHLISEYKRIESTIKKHQKEKKRVMKLTQSSLSSYSPSEKKTKKKDKSVVDVADGELEEDSAEQILTPKGVRKEKSSGAYLRSNTILTPLQAVGNKTSKKVDEILLELGIGIRPMPTAAVCKIFNEIRQDIVALLDLQKHVKEKEYQVKMMKDKQLKSSEFEPISVVDSFAFPDPFFKPKKRPLGGTEKLEKKPKKKKKEKDYN